MILFKKPAMLVSAKAC